MSHFIKSRISFKCRESLKAALDELAAKYGVEILENARIKGYNMASVRCDFGLSSTEIQKISGGSRRGFGGIAFNWSEEEQKFSLTVDNLDGSKNEVALNFIKQRYGLIEAKRQMVAKGYWVVAEKDGAIRFQSTRKTASLLSRNKKTQQRQNVSLRV